MSRHDHDRRRRAKDRTRKHSGAGGEPAVDFVGEFVMQVLRTGLMLEGMLSDLIEDLPDDAYPGQDKGAVLIEMLTGTIRPVAEAAGERLVRGATRLLEASSRRTLDDLRAALALRIAMDANARHQG